MRFEFILAEKVNFPVEAMCRVLEVSSRGFYAWCRRPESVRRRDDAKFTVAITVAHERSRQTYGSLG